VDSSIMKSRPKYLIVGAKENAEYWLTCQTFPDFTDEEKVQQRLKRALNKGARSIM
jgi:hypothetical protein